MNHLPTQFLITRIKLVENKLLTKFSATNSSSNVSNSRGLNSKGVESSEDSNPLRGLDVKSIGEEACDIVTLAVLYFVLGAIQYMLDFVLGTIQFICSQA